MGFLDKLKPQPRWKHADAAVRLEAIRQLDDDADLGVMAEADPDVRVRRAAIDRLSEPAPLGAIARNDADQETRDRAADRLVALATRVPGSDPAGEGTDLDVAMRAVELLGDSRRLSTVAKGDAAEPVCRNALARVTDERALGSIARHASRTAIAAAALERVTGDAELLEIALNAEDRDVASAAFDRLAPLSDLAQLRAIEVRALHKSVSRRARTMIQETEAAEAARHAAALERQRRESMLCDAAEQLAEIADVAVARAELKRVSEAWQALAVTEPAVLSRFNQAAGAAEAAIVRRQREADEALDRQRARAEAIATRVALCERIETVDGDDALEQLAPLEEEWRSLLPLVGEGPEADRLTERFAQAIGACHKRHALGAALSESRTRLEALVAEAEALPGQDDAEAAQARWTSLTREAQGLAATLVAASRPAADLQERMTAVQQAFAARATARAAASEQARQQVVVLVTRLSERARRASEAETITLREGERLMRDIGAALETAGEARSADDLNAAVATLRTLQEAIAPRVRELREMDDWRRFANAQRQEQLIGMAEAIVLSLKNDEGSGSASDLAATAKALRELHAQWHTVAEAPRQSAQRLWDRFRTATDFIRSRCETYFVQVRHERDAALQKKTEIVAEAEVLASSSDWIGAASRLQALQTEWQALGHAGRESERVLAQRLRAACNTFFTRRREDLADRKKVWSDNLARKEALCVKAEAIAVSTEWDTAAAEMKQLQAEWKTIGPVRKNKSEVIWQRFRTAADQFFERYHNRHEIALSAKLAEREAIVVGLERLATLPTDDMPADFAEQVQALRTTWQKSAPIPGPGMRVLADRWQAALTQAVLVRPDAFAGTDLDPAAVVHRMEKLVARVESLVSEHCHTKETRLSPTELLAARLRDALASNAMGGRSHEEQKWRATADLVKDAQTAWQRLPPVDTPEAQVLGQRFRDACRRLTEHVRRHTSPQPSHAPSAGAPGRRPHQPRIEAAAV